MYMEMVCPSLDHQTWYYNRPLTAYKIGSLISRACRTLSSSHIKTDVTLMGHMLNSDPAKRPTPSTLLKQSVFGSTKTPPRGAMEVPESAVVPQPEADGAEADPLEGKHIFDPAEAAEIPAGGGEVALSTELELMPPHVVSIVPFVRLHVSSIVVVAQTDGAQWVLERCVLQCDSGVSTPEEYEMTRTEVRRRGDYYISAQFDASIADGPKKCSLYAIGSKASGGNRVKYRSLKKSFSVAGFRW